MNILILGPYGILQPEHAGALRSAAVVAAYLADGHIVTYSGVSDVCSGRDEAVGPDDVQLSARLRQMASASGLAVDIGVGVALASDPGAFGQYAALVRRVAPDILQFEGAALWPVVRRLCAEVLPETAEIVHTSGDSGTFEPMDRSSLALGVKPGAAVLQRYSREIAGVANRVFTVSPDDADVFRQMGVRDVQVIPDGVTPYPVQASARRALKDYLGPLPHALYVDSADPSSADALLKLMKSAERDILSGGRLLVAGGVADLIAEAQDRASIPALRRRTRLLGVVKSELMGELYDTAHAVILPKSADVGSNLKTAEALISGRPIVATTKAFIGFEQFKTLPWVRISDDPTEFWTHVDESLTAPFQPSADPSALRQLDWSERLKPMITSAARLGSGKRAPATS